LSISIASPILSIDGSHLRWGLDVPEIHQSQDKAMEAIVLAKSRKVRGTLRLLRDSSAQVALV
jgi:hypothetical protein